MNGWAIQARIYAENPFENFIPSYGKIKEYRSPGGPGIRFDSGIDNYSEVSVYYDPIIAKLISWGKNRDEAIKRLIRALKETTISGIITNIPFNIFLLESEEFQKNRFDTDFIQNRLEEFLQFKWNEISDEDVKLLNAIFLNIDDYTNNKKNYKVSSPSKWILRRWE